MKSSQREIPYYKLLQLIDKLVPEKRIALLFLSLVALLKTCWNKEYSYA